jgi:hypothetical protein
MLARGYIAAPRFNATFAHKSKIVEQYLNDIEQEFYVLAGAIRDGDVEHRLQGPVKHSEFRRLT